MATVPVDLFRCGNANNARFEDVRTSPPRPPTDTQDVEIRSDADQTVIAGSGGMSTFAQWDPTWTKNIWRLKQGSDIPEGLKIVLDEPPTGHYIIQAEYDMPLSEYRDLLRPLDYLADGPYKQPPTMAEVLNPLSVKSTHHDRATRFIYGVLVAVAHKKFHIDDWDDNDYTYIGRLARSLDSGELSLQKLLGFKKSAIVIQALTAWIDHTAAKAEGNEDAEAEIANDGAYLRGVLKSAGHAVA